MFTIEEAQAFLAAVGSDSAPSIDQLQGSRAAFVDAAKTAKTKGDREALATMLEAIKLTDAAIAEAEKLQAAEAEELESLVADFPELADEQPAEEELSTKTEEKADTKPKGALLSIQEAAARLGAGTQAAPQVEVSEPAQTLSINGEDRSDASLGDLAASFAKFTKQSLRGGRSTIATFRTEYDNQLSGRVGENTMLLDSLTRRSGEEAVIAAGGCCSLATPLRDQPMLSSLARPIADSLPTIGAQTGKVIFHSPLCGPVGGVGTWTCEQDENVDPDDPDTWKQCVEIDCAEPEEVTVEAIYHCLTIGNFQHRFAPERWEEVLHRTMVEQARLAEQTLFNQLVNSDHTTNHTIADTGSIYANVVRAGLTAAATIRQKNRYEGRRFKWIMPSWVRDAAELDLLARAIKRGRSVEADALEVVLSRAGIDVTWTPDVNPIEPDAQEDGPLTNLPDEFDSLLYVDGGAFRLDGGELNLGTEIRDHDLNRQNKLAAFGESFEAAVVRSCDTKAITVPATICDAVPCLDELPGNGDGNGDG